METNEERELLKEDLIRYIIAEKTNENEREEKKGYFHYTSLEVLFNILDGDSFWISNVRFSNDSTEERLIEEVGKNHDDYIICFCEDGDKLSQWRGYCHNGGVAINFNLHGPLEYSILHKDYDTTKEYERYVNCPLPVIYISNSVNSIKDCWDAIKARPCEYKDILEEELIPYIKNNAYKEEKELRLAFMNVEGTLSNCIRFRTLKNGVKIPYMVVKPGDAGRMLGSCATDPEFYTDDKLHELINNHEDIWIEEGGNQERVYYEILKKVEEFSKKNPLLRKIHIYCKGHMPIEEIIVAPTDDRERIAEQINRFCNSKYWLRNVEVTISQIPFIHH